MLSGSINPEDEEKALTYSPVEGLVTKPLPAPTLRSILTAPKNAIIKQYKKLFEMDNINFSITDGALDYIVEKAMQYKLGARGLRSLCEAILTDAMYELPESDETEFKVTKDYAEKKLNKSTIKKLKAVS